MTASLSPRYRLDDLRRLATELTSKLGVAPARSSALATHLLWFDAVGASFHGISTLPNWLDRLETKQVDPKAEGRAMHEHAGTAVFDAQQGLPPLALETAGRIALEKARDVGIGIVRVRNIGPTGPAAPVVSGLAIGPFVAMIAGPSPSLALALPMPEGPPALYDSGLENLVGSGTSTEPPEGWEGVLAPWISTVSGGDGWLILSLSVPAFESLTSFHERAARAPRPPVEGRTTLWPDVQERRRLEARELGVPLDPATIASLKEWAERTNAPWPDECGG